MQVSLKKKDEKLEKKKMRNMSYHAYFLLLIIWNKMMNKMYHEALAMKRHTIAFSLRQRVPLLEPSSYSDKSRVGYWEEGTTCERLTCFIMAGEERDC